MKSLGIYIHIPFCVQKCVYCDFLSAPADRGTQVEYMQALKREIVNESPKYSDYLVETVFFGGGTPSILEAADIADCLDCVREHFTLAEEAEITLEMNPKTASYEKLKDLKKTGINRLSIGLQSANDEELRLLGRVHTFKDFLQTYEWARLAGFKNINIDLISSLPGQSLETWTNTLNEVLRLKPEHISAYSLIVEEGTKLYDNIDRYPPIPDDETDRLMYKETKQMLSKYNYMRYEISNYAKEGFESRHNTIYWQRGKNHIHNYLGFGPGASSTMENLRWKNTDDMKKYLSLLKSPIKENEETLTENELMEEFMFLGLRMIKGIRTAEFAQTFDCDIHNIYGSIIKKWQDKKLLVESNGYIFLTDEGLDVSNKIFADFLL